MWGIQNRFLEADRRLHHANISYSQSPRPQPYLPVTAAGGVELRQPLARAGLLPGLAVRALGLSLPNGRRLLHTNVIPPSWN